MHNGASEARVAQQTIYDAFANKEAILRGHIEALNNSASEKHLERLLGTLERLVLDAVG